MHQAQTSGCAGRNSHPSWGWVCAIFFFLAMTVHAPSLPAAVVFDNFDSGGGFNTKSNMPVAGSLAGGICWAYNTAAQFTVNGGDFYLSSISLPISFEGGSSSRFRVRLTEDNAGSPGTPGATLEVLSENQSIWPNFTVPFTTTTTLTSTTLPILSDGGRYWIVTELTDYYLERGDSAIGYLWALNLSGTEVPLFRQDVWSFEILYPWDPIAWEQSLDSHNLAFRVEGTVVPLPATAWLFGSGILGLFWAARRKSKKV